MNKGQLKLLCDAAYAFDYLSILHVKAKNDSADREKAYAYFECLDDLEKQLDPQLFEEILQSQEYYELKEANQYTFNLIEKIRNGEEVSIVELDKSNLQRFQKKQYLQNKFFQYSLQETKTHL